jgi:hypothetical protein
MVIEFSFGPFPKKICLQGAVITLDEIIQPICWKTCRSAYPPKERVSIALKF